MLGRLLSRVYERGVRQKYRGLSPALFTPTVDTQLRRLNVHEHVGMEIFQRFGVNVPRSVVVSNLANVKSAYATLFPSGDGDVVVKAQVLAGGRGKGRFSNGFQGGVHMADSAEEAQTIAQKMLGSSLITKQTTEEGQPCHKVLMVERLYLRRELYLSILLDRETGGPMMVASTAGGMDIEDVAEKTPHKILKEPINIVDGPAPGQLKRLAKNLGFKANKIDQVEGMLEKFYNMFMELDATMIEVNPLAETSDGKVMVCDAKFNFDANAEYRQQSVFERRDTSQEDPREVEASQQDLNYIGLTGNIGCMVNGAGLAMATMDIIKLHGGDPANFLDVGGGASETQVQKAFEILNDDPNVKAILVNIFGGIMRCDIIANGMISAAKCIGLSKPVILRLQGTNVKEATAAIESSQFRMIMADDLDDAALKAVRIADITKQAEQIQMNVSFNLPL